MDNAQFTPKESKGFAGTDTAFAIIIEIIQRFIGLIYIYIYIIATGINIQL